MILIYPPVAKPCEPPAGIARLLGALKAHGIKGSAVDANLEGMLYLLHQTQYPSDTWTYRAFRKRLDHLISLRGRGIYGQPGQYRRAVGDVNRVLEQSSADQGAIVSLSNYRHSKLSPVKSSDLVRAAGSPEENPFYPYFKSRLKESIESAGHRQIGFSLNYLSQALCTFAMIGFLKKTYAGLTIYLGGGLVTSWMSSPGWSNGRNPFAGLVDHMIAGPGERPLLSLRGVDALQEHYKPDYSPFLSNEYMAPGLILPYSASDGCYWSKCRFCPESVEGNPYRPIPAGQMQSEIDDLCGCGEKKRPVLVHVLDNAMSKSFMKSMSCVGAGTPWYGFARVEEPLADPSFCESLRLSGCVMLKLGIESGDQGVLDRMQKGTNLETVSRVLKTLAEAGIATYVYLIFGTPYESEYEAEKTLDFTVRHSSEIGFLNLALFNMPINSPDAAAFGTGTFYEGDLSLYTEFGHPKGWTRKRVKRFLEGTFKRHPAIAPIIRREPPFFTSNHAPLFKKPLPA
ncbi:MAG: radical SAM protein [Nitrospirae bacterium]|nr:radical SAM protein [Nitrospirota bacterium]